MQRSIFFINAETDGWQKLCREYANDDRCFHVTNINESHLLFCQQLCADYKYQHEISKDGQSVKFWPLLSSERAD